MFCQWLQPNDLKYDNMHFHNFSKATVKCINCTQHQVDIILLSNSSDPGLFKSSDHSYSYKMELKYA